ncbi:MAG TPA: glycosyltransferase [Chloroflexaceae bacterium]|nr:glycosyltransferase [Chloroflexaceae bacterium]
MPQQPTVSIITPFANPGPFLAEAVASVLRQTRGDWELLLVDDGSTDGSAAVALALAEQHPDRVRYLAHEGGGSRGKSAARNRGLAHARGAYIALLDADDVFHPEKLERQVAVLELHPEAGMVYGPTLSWHSWSGRPEDSRRDQLGRLGVEPERLFAPPELLTRFLRDGGMVPCTCGLLARRGLVEQVGGFDERIQDLYEDQVLIAKLCLAAPVYVSGFCGGRDRQHEGSSTAQAIRAGHYHPRRPNRARRAFLAWLARYCDERAVRDPALRRALRRALLPYRFPSAHGAVASAAELAGRLVGPARRRAAGLVPATVRRVFGAPPAPGRVRLGDLRRLAPVSRQFGYDRGQPVDRYYIERFLARNAADIRGRVLEIGDDAYTRQFGGDRVARRDVLHVSADNPLATFVGDLTNADVLPSDSFDCFILTQTLHLVYDIPAALRTVYRVLRPGGVVLATVPGISQISADQWADYWHWGLTSLSARRMFEELFPATHVSCEAFGNVLAATAFLYGLAAEELTPDELAHRDRQFEVTITIRALKPLELP